jgi:hypothetical protein
MRLETISPKVPILPSITRSRRKARFLTANIERNPEAANTTFALINPAGADDITRPSDSGKLVASNRGQDFAPVWRYV